MIILDGKKYRDQLLEQYKKTILEEKLKIKLDIILIGDDPASLIYVKNKIKYAKMIGIETELHHLDEGTKESAVCDLIDKLNSDPSTTGIIIQSPTPLLDFEKLSEHLLPAKDVDGLVSANIINLYHNKERILPCTVKGILMLLEFYNISLKGKNVTIIGRGDIVGKPLSLALANRGSTVTVCDEYTKNLSTHTKNADIIISAVGKKDLIKESMVSDGFIGIDVGITRVDNKIYGDFAFKETSKHASYITPVPGGIGPMTIALIMGNLIDMKRNEKNG